MEMFQVSKYCCVAIWDIERLQIPFLHLRCHTGLFFHLLRLTAYVYNIEYIIVDTSPDCSMFNQAIFMSSDGFFMPSRVDLEVRETSRCLPCHCIVCCSRAHISHCCAVPPGI